MREKFIKAARLTISIIYVPAFIIILMLAALSMCESSPVMSVRNAPLISGMLILIVCFGFFALLKKLEDGGVCGKRLPEKTANCVFVVCWLGMLAFQIYTAFKLRYLPVTDSLFVDLGARTAAYDGGFSVVQEKLIGHHRYFSCYPNNWAILMLTAAVYKIVYVIFGRVPYMTAPFLSIACIQVSAIMLFLTAKLIFKDKSRQVFVALFTAALPVFLLYSQIFYTDTLSMPFVISAVYCFIRACREEKLRSFALWMLSAAVLVGIGYTIKGSLCVILVALVMYGFMKMKPKRATVSAVLLVAFLLVFNSLVLNMGLALKLTTREKLEHDRIPTIHWIMMSSVGHGGYDPEMYAYTASFAGYDNKVKADKEKLAEIMSEYTPEAFIEHLIIKCTYTWDDGKYFAVHHLSGAQDSDIHSFFDRG